MTTNISDVVTITFYTLFNIDGVNHTITLIDFSDAVDYRDFTYDTEDDYPTLIPSQDTPNIPITK